MDLSNVLSAIVNPNNYGFVNDLINDHMDFFPPVQDNLVTSPSSGESLSNLKEDSEYTFMSNSQYYDDYLNMLQKGSDIGLFSTAQDVVNEAQKDRLFQSLEAQKERDWYENLSNTAYQRQVKDLEAAGLNPILGFANLGTGASSAHTQVPSGSSTNIRADAPSLSDYLNAGANIVSSAGKLLSGVGSLLKVF